MVPEEQETVYLICYTMGIKHSYILDNLIPDNYIFHKRYLDFLISNNLVDESVDVWRKIRTRFNPDKSEYIVYCDFLIGSGELQKASALWDDFAKKFNIGAKNRAPDEMIWNGDFEMPMENGGFDWKIGMSEGVKIFRDRDIKWKGLTSLRINFNGKTNPGIIIARQIV